MNWLEDRLQKAQIHRKAVYTTEEILLEEVNAYEKLVNRLFEVIDDWRKNNP